MRLRILVAVTGLLAGLGLPALATSAPGEDLTALVNPLSGSLGAGFVTVGAGVPFGMATPGPATTTPAGDDPVNYIGDSYQDPEIRGFALNHFSGAGIHIGGELPFLPTTGAVTSSDPSQFASPYEHATETSTPGYYAATLARYGVRAEMTATTRVALERFTFPAGAQRNVLLDVSRDNDGLQNGALTIVDAHTVRGSVSKPGGQGFTIWFTARFDPPIAATGTWLGSTLVPGGRAAHGTGAGGWVSFADTGAPVVTARVGLSWLSADGADANLAAEAPDGSGFDAVRRQAHDAWQQRLAAVQVSGGFGRQRQTFYTALYHSLLLPMTYDDADGRYLGFDGAAHQVGDGHHHYTDLSLWDTFRTQTPLLTLVAPDIAHDVGTSLLDDADQNGGHVPQWVYANFDTGTMNGNSGIPTLAMLAAGGVLDDAESRHALSLLAAQQRDHLADYLRLGYVPVQDSDIAAPLTLEYAADDAAVALLAQRLGDTVTAATFTARSRSWRNLMDPSTHFLRPRNADGTWADPTDLGVTKTFDPNMPDGWQEGTGWQWLWLVPHNPNALADAMGGQPVAQQRLDQFFDTPVASETAPVVPLAQDELGFFGVFYAGNQYAPGNETDIQAPWLYDFLGQPWKTQRVVHAATQAFNDTAYGLPGNDDAGTMSSWYVLAALGLYQVVPGDDVWELSSPLFDSTVIRPAGTRAIRITAPGAGPGHEYVTAAAVGHRAIDRAWVTGAELRHGGLSYLLAPDPDPRWGASVAARPPVVG